MTNPPTKNTSAFYAQAAIAFGLAAIGVIGGEVYLPVGGWPRAFLVLGTVFLVTSSFTLAKVIRDAQDSGSVVSRLDQARLERLLAEFDPYKMPDLPAAGAGDDADLRPRRWTPHRRCLPSRLSSADTPTARQQAHRPPARTRRPCDPTTSARPGPHQRAGALFRAPDSLGRSALPRRPVSDGPPARGPTAATATVGLVRTSPTVTGVRLSLWRAAALFRVVSLLFCLALIVNGAPVRPSGRGLAVAGRWS